MVNQLFTDEAVLGDIGHRLSRVRLRANLTQAALARRAGVSRSTVERLESGQSTQLANFVRILRVLDLLEPVLQSLPEAGPTPMELIRAGSGRRQRARKSAVDSAEGGGPWRWGDEE